MDFDLFVIGAGSGGVRAARMAAGFGAKVGLCEERYFGGTCVNVGCVPKKLMVYAAGYGAHADDAAGFGWQFGDRSFDWSTLIANKDREIERLQGIYKWLLRECTVVEGRGRLVDAHTVEVNGQTYTAQNILVATGGWPTKPDIPGADLGITSNEVFSLPEQPKHIVVVGGGYIAVEFAAIFHGLGTKVTQLYRGPLFLRGFDHDVREFLAAEMKKTGLDLHFDTNLTSIAKTGSGRLNCELTFGGPLEADQVFFATGRHPLTTDLGLERAGIHTDRKGAIVVDGQYKTNIPSIYAVGDVTNRVNLTPVALAEGMTVARRLFAGMDPTVDYDNIPTAVFSRPNIGTVGMTQEEAEAAGHEVVLFKSDFRAMVHTMSGRDERTFMKLIVDAKTDRVLGCHMVGDHAGEIIQGIAIAMRAGATKQTFDTTIGIHPTAAEEFVTMRTPAT
jgi:glutathione reductase (NADPH)